MATKSMRYDHPAYQAVLAAAQGEVGGAATTGYNKFACFTAMILKSVQATVTVAGTATTNILTINKIAAGGTATTSIGSITLSTSTVGTTTNVAITSGTLAQGDIVQANTGADATGKSAVTYEFVVVPGATVTA
jgi:hypothetical protein